MLLMYRHLVNEIYHTVMYILLPIDYVYDRQSAVRTDPESVLVADWLSCTLTMYTTANQRPKLTSCT